MIEKRPLYRRWRQIRQTVFNPRDKGYANIGGRGLGISWNTYLEFEEYILNTLGPPPNGPDSKLHRINQRRGYEPGNLRWATAWEVGNNQPQNLRIRFGGETHSFSWWCRQQGLRTDTVRGRIKRHGWSMLEALNLRPRRRHHATR